MTQKILLVEDDAALREVTAKGLEQAGYEVETEGDGRLALIRFRQGNFDLVLLDLMLPTLGGIEVCRQIRDERPTPVVMLTAKTDTSDVVLGLEVGADDYVTKPFEIDELLARLRAVLRRAQPPQDDSTLHVAGLEIDPGSFRVSKNGEDIPMTATEFRLLYELARTPGRVKSRDVLLESVWNYDYLGDSRIVDMAVRRVREKIEDDPKEPTRIKTVRGVGYRFES